MSALFPGKLCCGQASRFLTGVCRLLLAEVLFTAIGSAQFSPAPPVIDPAYAASYSASDIGFPSGVSGAVEAIVFKDANTLYVADKSFTAAGEIVSITVTRGAGQHITGFSGNVTKIANAPYIDGGMQFGPNGVLFYTAYSTATPSVGNRLGQIKPGSTNPDKLTDLGPLGVSPSVGSLSFVPSGFGGGGGLKLVSWDAMTWYSTTIAADGSGTYTISSASSSTALPPAYWEGSAYVKAGQPLFAANSVLINASHLEAVYAFEVDADGNPRTSTSKHFMDVSNPVGMTVDPVTGDLLISTGQGLLAGHITIVKGVAGSTPTVTASKATYAPGEAVQVSFANAPANAGDWIGLYTAGAANTAYLQWLYTDGTQTGTAGKINGSVNFPNGLTGAGSYQARLFVNNTYTALATVAFSVAAGPPGAAANPSPTNNATGISANPTLSWTAGSGATSHKVYLSTNSNPGAGDLKSTQAGATFTPGALASQTAYFWRIDEVNAQGATTTGTVWKFTTGAASVTTLTTSKAAYAANESISVNFTNAPGNAFDWIGLYAAGAANTAYLQWLYTDGTQTGTAGKINGTVQFPNGLAGAGNYQARLFLNNSTTLLATAAFSVSSAGGLPAPASTPGPANGAEGIGTHPTLTWTAGAGATSHKVYFGMSASLGASDLKSTQSGTSFTPFATSLARTFYWRVDEVNAQGTTTGAVWQFSTLGTFSSAPPVVDPAYAASYSAVDLGGPLPGVNEGFGALVFKDKDTLYVTKNSYHPPAEILAVTVTRDAGQHITGFSGTPIHVANAPNVDGGMQFAPNGTLLYTAYDINTFGQIKPGSTGPDKVTDLGPLGVPPSVGSLALVPSGFGGAGSLKLISFQGQTWYTTSITPDGAGTYTVSPVSSSTPLPQVYWEGIAYVAAGQPLFPTNSVLIAADLTEAVYAFEVDANGNPLTATVKHFMDVSDPVGMTFDPVTGDVLIGAEKGPLGAHIFVVRGFSPPASSPPGAASSPSPANNATGVGLSPTLSWTGGSGATSHKIYLGTNAIPGSGDLKSTQPGTSYTSGTLVPLTTYFWRVDELNAQGTTTTGVVWKFTTGGGASAAVTTNKTTYAPGEAIQVNFTNAPGNASDWIGIYAAGTANTAYLQWLYTDGTQTGAAGKLNGSVNFSSGLATPGNYEARLLFNGSYVSAASIAFAVATGSPGAASNPNPAANATGVSLSPTLSWTAGSGAASHKVYLGGSINPGAGDLKSTQSGTSYATGALTAQTAYFWRVDEVNGQGTTTGAVWKFTTGGGAAAAVTTSKAIYARGETIQVNFANATGNASDWIGLFAAGAANTAYLQWFYTDGTQTGTAGRINGSVTFPGGFTTAGNYQARLLFNGSYVSAASVSFTVLP